MRAPRYLLGTAMIAAVALAGCSGPSSENASSSAGSADKAAAGPAAQAPQQAGGGAVKDEVAKAPNLSVDQRSIIYTGTITVRVKDVTVAAAQASGYATAAGGFIGGDERHKGSTDSATMIFRVPAERFSGMVQQLAELGDEQTRQTSTEDVTEQAIDLDARITVQQARVDSGRRLLAQAKSLSDLVMLEKEVATRESDLASLQAKKRKLADLTALSTITAVFLGPEAAAPKPKDDNPAGFLTGLSNGWHALLASLAVLLTILGALLPWLIALGIPAYAVFYLLRRYRRKPEPTA